MGVQLKDLLPAIGRMEDRGVGKGKITVGFHAPQPLSPALSRVEGLSRKLARIFHTLRCETAEVAADQGLTKVRRMTVCWNTWKSADEASP